jgi:cysteine desulfurase family protein
MIYLDNAATTLKKPDCVVQAVTHALTSMGNSARGTHDSALQSARSVFQARSSIAKLFNAPGPERVAFTKNSTEALNLAICGLFNQGDHVITTDLEHNSVLRPLYRLESEGIITLSVVPADKTGRVDYDDFTRLLCGQTRGIVCTHASNLTGNTLDLHRIGQIARAHNLFLVVDASQSAGVLDIDMEQMGISVLCFTGHKSLMGPQGTGGLCVARDVDLRPLQVGGSGTESFSPTHPTEMPTRLEAGTLNGHGIAGLGAGVDFILETGVERIRRHEIALAKRFYDGVTNLPGITVYGDFSSWERTAVVALNIGDYDSGAVSDALWEDYAIATRPGAHCAPRLHNVLGTAEQGAVRFSFCWFNTEEEVDTAISALRELAQ